MPLAAQMNTGCFRHSPSPLLLSATLACLILCMDVLLPFVASGLTSIVAFAATSMTAYSTVD